MKNELDSARWLQNGVREDEQVQRDAGQDYTPQHIRQSIVHTREDMVLLVSHLAGIHKAVNKIDRKLAWFLLLFIAATIVLGLR